MPKKKLPQTIEECNAELERTQKLLQQYENRNKILNRKLSVEKRKSAITVFSCLAASWKALCRN